MTTAVEYLEARFARTDGCWAWSKPVQPTGYGLANLPDRTRRPRRIGAHRAVYEYLVGPIPAGMTLDHGCHNRDLSCPGGRTCPHRRCVNPSHLEVVTRGENARRGRGTPAVNLAKDRCKRGHEYDIVSARGWRSCSTCRRITYDIRSRARGVPASRRGAAECSYGHAFTDENIRISKGKRYCKTCDRRRLREWQLARVKPCKGCGGPKPAGRARRYCDGCQRERAA